MNETKIGFLLFDYLFKLWILIRHDGTEGNGGESEEKSGTSDGSNGNRIAGNPESI